MTDTIDSERSEASVRWDLGPHAPGASPPNPMGVLYIDDDEEARTLLPRFLEAAGPLRLARDVEAARRAIASACPDLIVVDPAVPGGDVVELLAETRATHPWVQTFILLGREAAADTAGFIAAGADDIAVKPFDVGTLEHRCARLLQAAEANHREASYRRKLEVRLSHAERIATLGTLAATIVHEINNPLGAVLANADYLAQELRALRVGADPADQISAAEDIATAARTILTFIDRIRAFSRRDEERPVEGDLEHAIRTVLLLLKPRILASGARIVMPTGPAPIARHYPVRLIQALLNVVVNAIEVTPRGGSIVLRYVDRDDAVGIIVEDEGPGLSEEMRARALEPFFTTKATGTGIGLAVVQDVMRDHEGRFELLPRAGRSGVSAGLLLPRRRSPLNGAGCR